MQRKLTRGGSLPAKSPLARSPLELGGTGDMAAGTGGADTESLH